MDDILEFRPATEQERIYTYAQTHELYMHSACVGRLRGDFDSGGYGFYTTWEDHHGAEKTAEFKAEFDRVVNALRDPSAYHGVLFSRDAMRAFCGTQPDSAMHGNYTTEYAFRVNTEKYAYVMRLNPTKGDYNFYIFCYEKRRLDRFLADSAKGIRFITPHYKEIFRIPDGDQIRIIRPEGDYIDRTVRFIDEYHMEVGFLSQANIYHICEFAERMEQNGSTVIPLRSSLPKECYSTLPSTGEIILIKRGDKGYYPADVQGHGVGTVDNREIVDALNRESGVTRAQEAAMQAGSIFGWATPAADPKNYNEKGELLKPGRPERGEAR